jgi:elongation factor Ts
MSMSGINAQSIKELRERTSAGMSDCKSALVEAEGDMEKAVEIILKKGIVKTAKRAGAVAAEGEVRASVAADKQSATIVEVNIQTDFAARNDAFKEFVSKVLAVAERSTHGADLHTELHAHGKTVGDIAVELTGKIGEKVQVRRWARVEIPAGKHGFTHAYVHMGGKIGVVLALETGTADAAANPAIAALADDLAMHIAASTPLVLRRSEISADDAAKQKEIFIAQLKEDPKTAAKEAQWPKMIEGKLNKWYSEVALLEQESVVTKSDDAGKPLPIEKIEKLLEKAGKALGTTVVIDRFVRFERGEGIARENKDDFAAEVARMAGG